MSPGKVRIYITTILLKTVIRTICRVDARELSKIDTKGPMVISINHINFLEVPLIQTWLMPRKMRGFVKKETWENPIMRFLLNTYNAIPVERGGVNKVAFREVREALKEEKFICIAPEGTRSGTGVLQEGKPGITAMALMTGAPITPLVHYGGENVWSNLKRFKRTRITLKVGAPFYLESEKKTDSVIRDEMTREVMYQMASLLPEDLRGLYSDASRKTTNYLRFADK